MSKVCVIQGPNLNLLGNRETSLYGETSLDALHQDLIAYGKKLGLLVECFQSNHEGEIVDYLHHLKGETDYLIINAAAYTHTSVAIRDALLAVKVPAIEVHISNIYAREDFRHKSLIADIVQGQIAGLGVFGYRLALEAIANYLSKGERVFA